MWFQTYSLFGQGTVFSVLLASLPILTLLLMLAAFRKPAWIAGLCGLLVTFLLATVGYKMPVGMAISAASYGVAFGLFPISWLVFWAIALFRVTTESGQFEIIKNSIGRLTPDPRLQALLIAFAFGGFLEGAAGFGTPVAIAASMLIGLGFSPFSASAICLLANTAPVAFGSIGIPIITLAGTTGLPVNKLSGAIGAICTPVALIIPIYLIMAVGGRRSLKGIWTPMLVAGSVFAAVQLAVSVLIGPQLTDILAALCAIAALVVLLHLRRNDAYTADGATMLRFARMGSSAEVGELSIEKKAIPQQPAATVARAWMPYGLLVTCVVVWGLKPVQAMLDSVSHVSAWPGLHNLVQRMPPIAQIAAPYPALYTINVLSSAGTACMLATLLTVILLRISPARFGRVLIMVVKQLRLPTATVSAVLAVAFLMNYSGATATLGLAFAATGKGFPFFSALLGWLGVFLTGSDTSSNALFGNLQVVTAQRLGFNPVLMAAANSSGGVMGKMISLQTIAIAAAATGLDSADQVRLFRFTLKHSVGLAGLVGLITLVYVYGFHLW